MRIDISKLRDGEILSVSHEYDSKALSLEQCDLRYLTPLKLEGTLGRVGDSLFFKGNLTARIENICTRCLKAIRKSADESFDLYFPVKDEEFLETTDEIREVMLLAYPVKFLCSENCRGLCPYCGKNLNEGPCQCAGREDKEGFPGSFDKLKQWHKKQQPEDK